MNERLKYYWYEVMNVTLFQCEDRQAFLLILGPRAMILSLHLQGMTARHAGQCFLTQKRSILPGLMERGKFSVYCSVPKVW
jgi:hypothetical protein